MSLQTLRTRLEKLEKAAGSGLPLLILKAPGDPEPEIDPRKPAIVFTMSDPVDLAEPDDSGAAQAQAESRAAEAQKLLDQAAALIDQAEALQGPAPSVDHEQPQQQEDHQAEPAAEIQEPEPERPSWKQGQEGLRLDHALRKQSGPGGWT